MVFITDAEVRRRIEWISGAIIFWLDDITEFHDDEWLQVVYAIAKLRAGVDGRDAALGAAA